MTAIKLGNLLHCTAEDRYNIPRCTLKSHLKSDVIRKKLCRYSIIDQELEARAQKLNRPFAKHDFDEIDKLYRGFVFKKWTKNKFPWQKRTTSELHKK